MENTKRYITKFPTNGHEVGDEVFLTDEEVANANGGEAEPRYVLAEGQGVAETVDTGAAMGGVVATEETIPSAPVNPDSEAPATA